MFLYLLHKAHIFFGRISERRVQRVHSRCALAVPKTSDFSDPVYTEERLPPPQMFRYFSYNFLRPAFFFSFKIMCSFVSFLFRAFSHSNYIFSFPTKCTCTIEHLYCLLNFCYMFRRSLRLPQEELLSLLKYVGDN